jgi:hypothetical protein
MIPAGSIGISRPAVLAGLLSFAFAACLSAARSQEMEVPVEIQCRLIPKIVSYDRAFASRHHAELVVGILYQHGYRRSVQVQMEMASALRALKSTDGGLPITVMPIDIEVDGWREVLTGSGAGVLYVAPLRAVDIGKISSTCHESGLLTFTGVGAYIASGLVIAFEAENERPVIIVNLQAARAAGADLSSQLLRVARVVE